MKNDALKITRTGMHLFHWGLELHAGLILLVFCLGMFLMSGGQVVMQILVALNQWTPWVAPVFSILMIAGIAMSTAAPAESRSAPWAYSALAVSVLATLLTVAVYVSDLAANWLVAPGFLLILQALLYTRFLETLCSWIRDKEILDIMEAAKDQSASEALDAKVWGDIAGKFRRLFIVGIVFFVACIVYTLKPLLFLELGFPLYLTILAVGGLGFLILLARFSRAVYTLDKELRKNQSRTETADPTWDTVPADQIRGPGYLFGGLALASIAVGVWANQSLAPAYMAKQVEKLTAAFKKPAQNMAGKPAPDLLLTTIDGDSFNLSQLQGKVVVLNFWATWCGPCVREIPDLARLAEENSEDLVVIGITDEPQETAATFRKNHAVSYRLVSGKNWPAPFDSITSIPSTFVIDKGGVIRENLVGQQSYERFKASVENAGTAMAVAPAR